jgi:hypothetical protein
MRLFLIIVIWLAATSAALADTEIEIDAGACDTLVNYAEPPGVEYQPGVDASGNPVAPADIGGTPQLKPPQRIVVPITDYLAARLGGAAGTLSPQIPIGTVTLEGTQLMFNGQPISTDVDGELGALCRKARGQ